MSSSHPLQALEEAVHLPDQLSYALHQPTTIVASVQDTMDPRALLPG